MADTCIVCLGDLASAVDTSPTAESRPQDDFEPCSLEEVSKPCLETLQTLTSLQECPGTIAHLLPCGHDLHNECLKPWVERANSCPICRQNFNVVQLKSSTQGPFLSSYDVQDKRQVADLDPSMIVEEDIFEEPSTEPCLLCEHYGDEDVLLLCDGCYGSCHTYCAGLASVPAGSWFCQFCQDDPGIPYSAQTRTRSRRTPGQQWRMGSRLDQSSDAWARVWQSVWDNLNIDLDFPFNEDPELAGRTQHQLREFDEWQQRFRVAESHGASAAARFRDSAATLLEGRNLRSRGATQHPESQEEISAWNAFEKAREIESSRTGSPQGRNKRKSAPTSPADPHTEPEKRLKRPRTRRPREATEPSSRPNMQSLPNRAASNREDSTPAPTPRFHLNSETCNPSFFQSLLKEVETTPKSPDNMDVRLQPFNTILAASTDHSSPCSSSPPSSHPSPRLRPISPPPLRSSRPASPPLTSRIEPIFAQQPQFAPFSPEAPQLPDAEDRDHHRGRSAQTTSQRPRPPSYLQNNQSTQASSESPTRDRVRCMKAEIQRMVSTALKPAYKKHEIDSDEFTWINKDISRKLYDKVGDAGNFEDVTEKEKWQIEANHQVDAAVKRIRKSSEVQLIA